MVRDDKNKNNNRISIAPYGRNCRVRWNVFFSRTTCFGAFIVRIDAIAVTRLTKHHHFWPRVRLLATNIAVITFSFLLDLPGPIRMNERVNERAYSKTTGVIFAI